MAGPRLRHAKPARPSLHFNSTKRAGRPPGLGHIAETIRCAELPADLLIELDDVFKVLWEKDLTAGDIRELFHVTAYGLKIFLQRWKWILQIGAFIPGDKVNRDMPRFCSLECPFEKPIELARGRSVFAVGQHDDRPASRCTVEFTAQCAIERRIKIGAVTHSAVHQFVNGSQDFGFVGVPSQGNLQFVIEIAERRSILGTERHNEGSDRAPHEIAFTLSAAAPVEQEEDVIRCGDRTEESDVMGFTALVDQEIIPGEVADKVAVGIVYGPVKLLESDSKFTEVCWTDFRLPLQNVDCFVRGESCVQPFAAFLRYCSAEACRLLLPRTPRHGRDSQ